MQDKRQAQGAAKPCKTGFGKNNAAKYGKRPDKPQALKQQINTVAGTLPTLFAVVAGSLEIHAQRELQSFGAQIITEIPRGIYFKCDLETLYKILYLSRLVQRILYPLIEFDCHSEKYLYRQAKANVPWTRLFSLEHSFGIDANVSNSFLRHSLYASQLLKDAICDSFREEYQKRPDFSNKTPDILFNLHIHNNRARIALDILGQSMHQRGYRKYTVEAPLQETLAAAIVNIADYKGQGKLLDPMCGSGTLLAEALMRFCQIPAGFLRDHSRLRFLPVHDSALWQKVQEESRGQIRELPASSFYGADISVKAIEAARENLALLPGGGKVVLKRMAFQEIERASGRIIITNPPYGVRLDYLAKVQKLYRDLGDFLKQKCPDSESYILCGSKDLVKELRLRAHWVKKLKNADLDTQLAKVIVKG